MKHMNTLFGTLASFVFAASIASAHAALTDSETIGFINKANSVEVSVGKIAIEKAQKDRVKQFATKLVAEHVANDAKLILLETKTKLTRAESEASKNLDQASKESLETINKASAADFDKTFINSEVVMHQRILSTIDQSLIPAVQNSDVKEFLQETRTVIEAHLKEAQTIQTELSR